MDGVKRVNRPKKLWVDKMKDVILGRGKSTQEVVNVVDDRNES